VDLIVYTWFGIDMCMRHDAGVGVVCQTIGRDTNEFPAAVEGPFTAAGPLDRTVGPL
jgi:hypothetical protein